MYIYVYINIYNTVICLEYSIIMTAENIYICTVKKSRHNNHIVMYNLKVLYYFHYYFRQDKLSEQDYQNTL